MISTSEVVAKALEWLDTPWIHNQSSKHLGADCVGFLWGLGSELGLELGKLKNYKRIPRGDELLNELSKWLTRDDTLQVNAGVVLAFDAQFLSVRAKPQARHVGLAISETHLIHAVYGKSIQVTVIGNNFDKISALYRIPGVKY